MSTKSLSPLPRKIISFELSKEDIMAMGAAVGRMQITGEFSPTDPGAFTIRNHTFSTEKPGAFTIRNYTFNTTEPSAFTIRNYAFSSK